MYTLVLATVLGTWGEILNLRPKDPGRFLSPLQMVFISLFFINLMLMIFSIKLHWSIIPGIGCGCIPIKPYLCEAVASRIWPFGYSLLIPDVEEQKWRGKRDAIRKIVITFELRSRGCMGACLVTSVMSSSLPSHSTRLLCPWARTCVLHLLYPQVGSWPLVLPGKSREQGRRLENLFFRKRQVSCSGKT